MSKTVKCVEIDNGVKAIFPDGTETIRTMYPLRVDAIPSQYSSKYFSYDCLSNCRQSSAKNQPKLFNIFWNLKRAETVLNRYKIDNKDLYNKFLLLFELLYKKGIFEYCECISNNFIYDDPTEWVSLLTNKQISNFVKNFEYTSYEYTNHVIATGLRNYAIFNIFNFKYDITKDFIKNCTTVSLNSLKNILKNEKTIYQIYTEQIKLANSVSEQFKKFQDTLPRYLVANTKLSDVVTVFKGSKNIGDILDALTQVKDYCKKLHCSVPNLEISYDHLKYYEKELKKEYQNKRTQIEEANFTEMQKTIPQWEYNEYKLYIPTTKNDCREVGKTFHNCFGDYEWDSYFKNQRRYGAVLYKDDKPVICLDVDVESKRIQQWLTFCNKTTHEYDDIKPLVQLHFKNIISD